MEISNKYNSVLANVQSFCKANLISSKQVTNGILPYNLKSLMTKNNISIQDLAASLDEKTRLTDINASNVSQCTPQRKIKILFHLLKINKGGKVPLTEEEFRNNELASYTNSELKVEFGLSTTTLTKLIQKVMTSLGRKGAVNHYLLAVFMEQFMKYVSTMDAESPETNRYIAEKLISERTKNPKKDDYILSFNAFTEDFNHIWTIQTVVDKNSKRKTQFAKIRLEDSEMVEAKQDLPPDAQKCFIDSKTIMEMEPPKKAVDVAKLMKFDYEKFLAQDSMKNKSKEEIQRIYMTSVFKPLIVVPSPKGLKSELLKNQIRFLNRYGKELFLEYWDQPLLDKTEEEIKKRALGKRLKKRGFKPLNRNYADMLSYSTQLGLEKLEEEENEIKDPESLI